MNTPRLVLLLIGLALPTGVAWAQANLRAVHAHGQTFLVWTDDLGLAGTNTYEVYASTSNPPSGLGDFRLVGRVLPADWRANRLQLAGASLRWTIPTDNAGGRYTLAANEALFVYTPHTAQPEYFVVLKTGNTTITAQNRVGPVAQTLDPVTCYVQHTGNFNGYPFADYAFWLDGAADENSGRPDFPIMGNQHFNGVPTIFRVYAPTSGLPVNPVPAVLFLHGNHGNWLNSKPEVVGWDRRLTNGLFITLDDGVWVVSRATNGTTQVAQEFTRWLGYWRELDRFNVQVGVLPPTNGVVVDYTIRRNAWIVNWLVANLPVDPHRVVLTGHSQGGSGGSLNVRARPELYAAAFLTSGTISSFESNLTGEMQGSVFQNLPTNLRRPDGSVIGVNDLYHPTTEASTHEPAFMRFLWGVNDDVVEWALGDFRDKPIAVTNLAALPRGAHIYWDERNHTMESWTVGAHHWVGSARLTANYFTRYRNDQSFPAIWNDQHADNDPFLACATNPGIPNAYCYQTNGPIQQWGTRGGYFEWDVDTITDTATNWAVTLWLVGASSHSNDVPAFDSAAAHVTIRRAQGFKPAVATTLHWRFVSAANPATVFQSGATMADAAGLVTVSNLVVFKDPQKGRLEVSTQPFGGDDPSTQLGLAAWHAHGQTWLVWNEQPGLSRRDTYDVYASSTAPTSLAQMQLIGRILPDDWRATRLKRAGDSLTFAIPDGQGGMKRLAVGEAVFVHTPHAATPEYFAVVRHGQTALGTGNVVGPVAQTLDSVTCHVQHTGVVNGHPFTDYALWVDGRADHTSGRPDFPVMANQHANGIAHLFRVYEPQNPPSEPRPAFIFLHGGEGAWTGNKAGEVGGVDLTPDGGWQINLDDNLVALFPDRVEEHQATKWAGYWEQFDRFDTNRIQPPAGSLIVTYTLRRNAWVVEWILRNHPMIDPHRVIMGGHSMGGSGGNVNLRFRPDLYAAALLFNGSTIVTTPGEMPFLLGVAEQNLPCDLPAVPGQPKPGITDLYAPWWRIVPGDIPLQVLVWGVNDPVSDWEPPRMDQSKKPYAMTQLNAHRVGAVVYWDEREHGLDDAVGRWAGTNPNQSDGSPRHTADFMRRFRNDQSFPALSNDTHERSNPSDFEEPFDDAANQAGHNWGTQGGYHNWDVTTLDDTPTRWAVTLWLTGDSTFATDIAPFDSAVADVSIRRPQQFKPAPGALLDWRFTRLDNGAVLQSGQLTVGADALVTVPRLTVFKDPLRGRLELTLVAAAPTLRITHQDLDNVTIAWTPPSGTNWVLQERLNLSVGSWTNSPSGWTNPVTVPATLPTKFYRLFKP